MIGKHWEEPGYGRRLRILRQFAVAVVILSLLGAAGRIIYRVGQWRGNSEAARHVAGSLASPDRDRVQAIEGMRRDAGLTIETLQQLAAQPGEVGQQARNALAHLRARLR